MRILICGHTSFASQGLPQLLRQAGHDVVCFGRGPAPARREDAELGEVVTGPVAEVDANPHLAASRPFDAVVNYILLKDESIERNVAYTQSLLRFCREASVRHLVHISSVSSHASSAKRIDEQAALETDPLAKGSYGSLKVASDQDVLTHRPPELKLTMVRPGFILGPGVIDPIVGTAARAPWNKLLLIGTAGGQFPVMERKLMNEAIRRALEDPPVEAVESLLLVADNSPGRREFVEAIAGELGAGQGVSAYPAPLWWLLAAGSEVVARLIGQSQLKPFSKLTSKLHRHRFDASRTQQRLGMRFDTDWKRLLRESLEGQHPNFKLPYKPTAQADRVAPGSAPNDVTYLGFGRIVKQKHLPALKRLGFAGRLLGYDLRAKTNEETGQQILALTDAPLAPADLYVVASPGPAHVDAIGRIADPGGTVLVEKPLCYNESELKRWQAFAAARRGPVLVCHNYRYKDNVIAMLRLLERRNPGRLLHAHVDFSSPPVNNDSAAWLRNERKARTLLLDYALHFVDLACMFCVPPSRWRLDHIRHELNSLGQTAVIQGGARAEYSVSFLLRQGFAPRRARLMFTFQNYSVSLGFFPETMVPHMAHDNPWLYKQEAAALSRATRRKVLDKLTGRDSDASHARVFAAAASSAAAAATLTVERLSGFYELLFTITRAVYGDSN
jgi:nucleoside-diphosphate-sugar epimerase